MSLKRKKGFNIATKSHQAKLLHNGVDFAKTKLFFNQVVQLYFRLVDKHPDGGDIAPNKGGGWRFYEALTIGDNPKYFIPSE